MRALVTWALDRVYGGKSSVGSGRKAVSGVSVRCKECKRHRCGRCGWSGRRKTGVVMGCPRCDHATTVHAVMHRNGYCSLADSSSKHKRYVCRWCDRVRRDDRMRRVGREWECKDVHGCDRVARQSRRVG